MMVEIILSVAIVINLLFIALMFGTIVAAVENMIQAHKQTSNSGDSDEE